MNQNKFLLFTDGGSRCNPGIAGAGAVLTDTTGQVIAKKSQPLGIRTNNQAEYEGLILGLHLAIKHEVQSLTVFMDSNLIVEQMSGHWKVKDQDLKKLFLEAQTLVRQITQIKFQHIPREKNKRADALANQAMDSQS